MKTQDELKQLYGVKYVEAFEYNQCIKKFDRFIKFLELKPEYIVADFGCGNGMLMEHVAPKVSFYIGVDFSGLFIQAAEKRRESLGIKNAEFICSEMKDSCKRNPERFDIGFALDFSEHIYDKEWLDILKGIRSSLKENGILYLHTPNAYFFIEILKARNFILKQFPEHIAVRTPEQTINLLEQAGFSDNKLYLLPHYNILKYIHPLSYIPVMGKYLKARIFVIAKK